MLEVFVAYASTNSYQGEMIRKVSSAASTDQRKILPWSSRDTSGAPISNSVEQWIERADAFIGDISEVNDNVTYEIAFAIGLGKPVRLMRSEHINFSPVKTVALLDTLGHDPYGLEHTLVKVLKKTDQTPRWPDIAKNRDQPVFILNPPKATDWSLRLVSAIKKIARLKFRSFNPWEISRLNASEAYELTVASYGVVVFWMNGDCEASMRNNQRAAFVYGLARGCGIPAILLANEIIQLPLDLQDQATRWSEYQDIDKIIRNFRDEVSDLQNDFIEARPHHESLILHINCGDPTAENEATDLSDYFLETSGYQQTYQGEANLLVGRKGSGKTAVFLQVRDRTRANKENIVIDLIPEGYQLIKLKEFILHQLAYGARKEVIAAFWEYVLWLEIAYKLLEKDKMRARRDSHLLVQYQALDELFKSRVDTGAGDFSERLQRLSDKIVDRFVASGTAGQQIDSSKVLEIVYGQEISELRNSVLSYLKLKGYVFFLLDNLDRFWTPGGFSDDDALIVIGLIESMQEITRKFGKRQVEFRWAVFVRSDVYEFLIGGMADYGKLAVQSLEWSDRELLRVLFERRAMSGVSSAIAWKDAWEQISVSIVDGKPVLDFLVEGSLLRPRYLIRLFETARRRAITFGRNKISDADYMAALAELGWQVIEDLDREIADLIPSGKDLLFEILQAGDDLTLAKFKYIVSKRLKSNETVEKLLDVMLWSGSIGVFENGEPKYIFDCGYKRQYLATLISSDAEIRLKIHPTLEAARH